MVKRKIIWSYRAKSKFKSILSFYTERNGSNDYSAKLFTRINAEVKLLISNPGLGIKTEAERVRGLIIGDYIVYYETTDAEIIIHTLWDCKQNPKDLIIK